MIIVRDIYKNFGDIKALAGISFSVENGVLALLGANGAGKTTLIRVITGYLIPNSGDVKINELDISEKRIDALRCIGYVPENNPIYQDVTPYEFIKSTADLWKISNDEFVKTFKDLVEKLEIKDVINQKISTLSKGYKRRVSIAASLIHNPKILILDEPTDGLDPNQKVIVRRFIKEYSKSNTVIVSTHIMEEVESMADRVLILNKGKVVLDTTITELRNMSKDDGIINTFYKITSDKE